MMKQKLSKLDIVTLVIGSVIGWGAFYLPGQKFLHQSGVINTLIGFMIGWLLLLFIQFAYHIMIDHNKEDGGEFTYTYRHLGETHGFIIGWALAFCYLTLIPLNATAITLVVKFIFPSFEWLRLYQVAGYPIYLSDLLISIGVILLFYAINRKGLSLSMSFQKILILLLTIIILGFTLMMLHSGDLEQFRASYIQDYQFDLAAILKVIAIIPFLFVGFDIVPQVLSSLGFRSGQVTKITILSTAIGVVIYNLLNLMTGLAYRPDQALDHNWATGSAIYEVAGWLGFAGLSVALLAAVIGGINGFMIGSSRIIASLSSKQLLPPHLKEHNHANTPENALKFVSLISILLLFLGREVILYIVDLSSLMAAVTYFYVSTISHRLAKERFEKVICRFSQWISFAFILLLLLPGSPSQLGLPSFVTLGLWTILGTLYYIHMRSRRS